MNDIKSEKDIADFNNRLFALDSNPKKMLSAMLIYIVPSIFHFWMDSDLSRHDKLDNEAKSRCIHRHGDVYSRWQVS